MAVNKNWTYTGSDGLSHTVELSKNKVTFDGGEPVKINKLKTNESNMVESYFLVPTDSSDVDVVSFAQ